MSSSVYVCYLFLIFVCSGQECLNPVLIEVDNVNGSDNPACLVIGGRSCQSLSFVLGSLVTSNYNESVDCIHLSLVPNEEAYNLEYRQTDILVQSMLTMVSSSESAAAKIACILSGKTNFSDKIEGDGVRSVLNFTGRSSFSSVEMRRISFARCERPIRFNNLTGLTVENCSFDGFTASAVMINNVFNFTVRDSTFTNSFTLPLPEDHRGNAGGLTINYLEPPFLYSNALITNSLFEGNTAGVPNQFFEIGSADANQLGANSFSGQFFGRGGGIGIFILDGKTVPIVNLTVEDCTIFNNTATGGGAGIYVAPFGDEINHFIVWRNCTIIKNLASEFGGGGHFGFPSFFTYPNKSTFLLEDVRFIDNSADIGGALSVFQAHLVGSGSLVTLRNCLIKGNTASTAAGILFLSSAIILEFEASNYLYQIENCQFIGNHGDGAFSAARIHTEFLGNNLFEDNEGTATELTGSLLALKGRLTYNRNRVETLRGAAMFFNQLGQLLLYKNSFLEFYNNTGKIGASIRVEVQEYTIISDFVWNPQCFLGFELPGLEPKNWENVTIVFKENIALVGSVIYSSFLNICSWFDGNVSSEVFSVKRFRKWPVFDISPNNYDTAHTNVSDDDLHVHIQTEAVTLEIKTSMVRAWPGQEVQLPIQFSDQYGNPTIMVLELELTSSVFISGKELRQDENGSVAIHPSLIMLLPYDNSVSIHFEVSLALAEELRKGESISFKVDISTIQNVRNLNEGNSTEVVLTNCLPGFYLDKGETNPNSYICKCSSLFHVLDCVNGSIIVMEGYWVGKGIGADLVLYPCPQPHCVCRKNILPSLVDCFELFDPSRPFDICYKGRWGVLCGRCKNGSGYGVGVLTTHCRKPVDYGYLLFIPLIVLQVVTITLIILLGVRILSVLKGLLFYMQVVPYLTDYYPIGFWATKQFLYCFSSLVGLYFPWDFSMYPDMPALVSFAMRYEILTITAITSTVIMAISFKFKFRSRYWSGLWTLILLTSGLTLYTSFGLLNCVSLPLSEGQSIRWYYDGEQVCFTNGHIPLAMLAIAVLLAYAVFTIVLFVYTLRPSLKRSARFNDFLSAVHRGYRKGREWYGPYELVRRFIVLLFVLAMPGVSVFPICIVLILFLVHIYAWPYKYWWQNVVEMMIFSSLLMLQLFRSAAFTPGVLNIPGDSQISVPRGASDTFLEVDGLLDPLAGFLLVWYYLPVGIVTLACVAVGIYQLFNGSLSKAVKKLSLKRDSTNPGASSETSLGTELVSYTTWHRQVSIKAESK